MRRFATLVDHLHFQTHEGDKIRLLVDYFITVGDPERGIGLGLLLGNALFGRVPLASLKHQLISQGDEDLFELTLELATDQIEALAVRWPQIKPSNGPPILYDLVQGLTIKDKATRIEIITDVMKQMEATERWVFLKCLTGGLSIGVTPALLRKALAACGDVSPGDLAEVWQGMSPPYLDMFAWLEGRVKRPDKGVAAPYKSMTQIAAIAREDATDLVRSGAWGFWEPPGVPVQWICKRGDVRLYTGEGDDISHLFPELMEPIPHDLRLIGQLTVATETGFLGTTDVARRVLRRRPNKDLSKTAPALLVIYDGLSLQGDQGGQTWLTRHKKLTGLLKNEQHFAFADVRSITSSLRLSDLLTSSCDERPIWAQSLLLLNENAPWPPARVNFDPKILKAALLYVEASTQGGLILTFGGWQEDHLVPIGKANIKRDDTTRSEVDAFVSAHTKEKFGPVREVVHDADTGLVLEISYRTVDSAPRKKSKLDLPGAQVMTVLKAQSPRDAVNVALLQVQIVS